MRISHDDGVRPSGRCARGLTTSTTLICMSRDVARATESGGRRCTWEQTGSVELSRNNTFVRLAAATRRDVTLPPCGLSGDTTVYKPEATARGGVHGGENSPKEKVVMGKMDEVRTG